MRKFKINGAKQLLDLNDQPFISKGVVFKNYLFWSGESRTDWTIRTAQPGGYTPVTGVSFPTFQAPYIWRNTDHIGAELNDIVKMGFNTIRLGSEPACGKTVSYTDLSNGITYPSDLEMIATIADMAADRKVYTVLTLGNQNCSQAQNDTYLQQLVALFKEGGPRENAWVGINPQNEINCAGGDPHGTCNNVTQWISDTSHYVSTLRTAGWTGLIFLCPPNSGWQLSAISTAFFANYTLNNDGGIVIEIHSYRQGDTFNTTRQNTEISYWRSLSNIFCIVVGEHGPTTDGVRYDGQLDPSVPTANATTHAANMAYESGFLPFMVDAIQNYNIQGLWIHDYRSFLCVSGSIVHSGNTTHRRDNGLTEWGKKVKDLFLDASAPPPPPSPYTTIFSQTLTSQSGSAGGFLFRNVYLAGAFSDDASVLRFTLKSPATSACVIAEAFISERAASGDDYDFVASPAATRITFGGNNGITIPSGNNSITSDDITFTIDKTKNYIISVSLTSGAVAYGAASGATYYYEASYSSFVATANISGMSAISSSHSIFSKVEKKN